MRDFLQTSASEKASMANDVLFNEMFTIKRYVHWGTTETALGFVRLYEA